MSYFSGFSVSGKVISNAGVEYQEPKIVNAYSHDRTVASVAPVPTDFTQWSEKDIVAFLEQRGEDYEDCIDFYALVARAAECEENTGPATQRPTQPVTGTDEEDPLEAFMADNEIAASKPSVQQPEVRHTAACDDADHMESYIAAHAARQQAVSKENVSTAYDSDEEVYATARAIEEANDASIDRSRKDVDPLPDIDHSTIDYKPFRRNFYDENPELFIMEDSEVLEARRGMQVQASGTDVPKPISEFYHCGLPKPLADVVAASGFRVPTAVQAQVLPVCFLV
jgi:hypothetical protein